MFTHFLAGLDVTRSVGQSFAFKSGSLLGGSRTLWLGLQPVRTPHRLLPLRSNRPMRRLTRLALWLRAPIRRLSATTVSARKESSLTALEPLLVQGSRCWSTWSTSVWNARLRPRPSSIYAACKLLPRTFSTPPTLSLVFSFATRTAPTNVYCSRMVATHSPPLLPTPVSNHRDPSPVARTLPGASPKFYYFRLTLIRPPVLWHTWIALAHLMWSNLNFSCYSKKIIYFLFAYLC